MRCHSCDVETEFEDKATGRYYCGTCWNIITATAYSDGFTIDEEHDTIQAGPFGKETGIDVSQDASGLPTLRT